MGLLDIILGRSKPKQANLDQLFGFPSAAITLQAATDFRPTGIGAVAFRQVEGAAFTSVEQEIKGLLGGDPDIAVQQANDGFGYTWEVVRSKSRDASSLVTSLHAVNSALEAQGFGPMLLCSTMYLRDSAGQALALVYLYKRGTFYPFAPVPGAQQRNSALELQIRGTIADDLRIEDDLSKWSPLWGAPGLDEAPAPDEEH